LKDAGVRTVFTDGEFEELLNAVRADLLPKLKEVRLGVQSNHSSDPPDEHMQDVLESFSTLKAQFSGDEDAVKLIEREIDLANQWIAETETPEPRVSPRTLGVVEPSEEKHGTRSIFDDIDEGDV